MLCAASKKQKAVEIYIFSGKIVKVTNLNHNMPKLMWIRDSFPSSGNSCPQNTLLIWSALQLKSYTIYFFLLYSAIQGLYYYTLSFQARDSLAKKLNISLEKYFDVLGHWIWDSKAKIDRAQDDQFKASKLKF